MFLLGTELFRETRFSDEKELESFVEKHAKLIFGDETIYLSKKMLVRTGEGQGTIPDAFVIDYKNDQWFIVEVELLAHGVWRHIVPQITSQIVGCLNPKTRELVTDRVLEYIATDSELKREAGFQKKVITILRKDPGVAIPIDGSSTDLETWARTQKLSVSIWEILKLESAAETGRIAYKIPSDNEASVIAQPGSKSIAVIRRASTKNVAALIDGGLLKDGEELFLTYKGKQFTGRASPEGVLLSDGNIYSPSIAATTCYAQVGSLRTTENGWRVWKDKAGKTLNELFDRLQAREETNA